MIYFTSDWHLNHKAVIRYSNRPFRDIHDMRQSLLENINNTVSKKCDKLFMLGDMTFGNKDGLLEFIESINAPLYIIAGNHDANNICNFLRRAGVNVLPKGAFSFLKDDLKITLTHKPLEDKYMVKNEFNICGHVHSSGGLMLDDTHYDCGVDNNNYFPVPLDYILQKRKMFLNK